VTVPLLEAVPVFAVAESVNEPLPILLAGVTLETVSHDWLLVGAFQVVLDVTDIVVFEAADVGDHVSGLTVSTAGAAACVTDIVLVIPPPVIVTVPLLEVVVVLTVAEIVNEPLPVLLAGVIFDIESHD
jgi:hypothetical protein